jgi:hypothetical protein
MISRVKRYFEKCLKAFTKTPFGQLVRLFIGRMFYGGAETRAEELDVGVGVIAILLAMPGLLASLLMFEEYGSLIRFLNGAGVYDPFSAAIPDEYFFIVLSLVVTGAVAVWRWDSIFLDRRDYMNLVPLPVSLPSLFFANLFAIFVLAGTFTMIVNVASLVLFPLAVVGSQGSVPIFLRFATGHATGVLLASMFSCFAVFAAAGLLMALLPARTFRRVSPIARFLVALALLGLLGSTFTVSGMISGISAAKAHWITKIPSMWFLGVARTVWGRSGEPFVAGMTRTAFGALGLAIFLATGTYLVSFRKSFMLIPESSEAGPLPLIKIRFSPIDFLLHGIRRASPQKGCYHFVAKTLLRSEGHLQVVSGFAALGLVVAVGTLATSPNPRVILAGSLPAVQFLSVFFILSYCIVVGIRFAFEIPVDMRANWIFRLWLDRERHNARSIARRVLLTFSLGWLAPLCFVSTFALWNWKVAMIHTAVLCLCTAVLIEILLVQFRKIPFTCSYPSFKSHSGILVVCYFFGFVIFTEYVSRMEGWSLLSPWRLVWFVPFLLTIVTSLHFYRKQMLDMDKELVFEDDSASGF